MTRCGCAGLTCACLLQGDGSSTTVAGEGTLANPYVISSSRGYVSVVDTPTINLTRSGQGTQSQPYVISADLIPQNLESLADVSLPSAPPPGNVLAWDGTQWVSQPPSTAPVGAVATGPCLTGDGSTANPLNPVLDPAGGLACGPNGLTGGVPLGGGLNQILAKSASADHAVQWVSQPVARTWSNAHASWHSGNNPWEVPSVAGYWAYSGTTLTLIRAGVYELSCSATTGTAASYSDFFVNPVTANVQRMGGSINIAGQGNRVSWSGLVVVAPNTATTWYLNVAAAVGGTQIGAIAYLGPAN